MVAACRSEATEPQPPVEMVTSVPAFEDTQTVLAWSEEEAEALRTRDWRAASEMIRLEGRPAGVELPERASVLAWAHVHAGQAQQAVPLLDMVDRSQWMPSSHRALLSAEIHVADGDLLGALAQLEDVREQSPVGTRALLMRARVLQELGRRSEAVPVLEGLAERVDPTDGGDTALLMLAESRGPGSAGATEAARRVWAHYPDGSHVTRAEEILSQDPSWRPTLAEGVYRARAWMDRGAYDRAISTVAPLRASLTDADEVGCLAAYVHGRSWYKKNSLSRAASAFGAFASKCADSAPETGKLIAYLDGKTAFRRGQYETAAKLYALLPDRYGQTTYADDGLTLGGIAKLEAGDPRGAEAMWRRGLREFSEGDTVPEAAFRLAYTLFKRGEVAEAIAIADQLSEMSSEVDEVHVWAGAYWAARWRSHPRPGGAVTNDADALLAAKERYAELCRRVPFSVYALMAHARLRELDAAYAMSVLDELARPKPVDEAPAWALPEALHHNEDARDAARLMRLGLAREALASWSRVPEAMVTPSVMGWWTSLRYAAGDWLMAHGRLHAWLRDHPVDTLGTVRDRLLYVAYPRQYGELIDQSAEGYGYPALLFQALVREESNFNKDIISFAGARGLSQVMPSTAKATAAWLEMPFRTSDLTTPDVNLKIGARYLDEVYRMQDDNPWAALASYNAGPRRVTGWITEWGNPPLDEWLEQVPLRETRGYAKRVSTTWQTYRLLYDRDAPFFPEMGRYNTGMRRD